MYAVDCMGSLGYSAVPHSLSRNEAHLRGTKPHLRPMLDGWCCEGKGQRAFDQSRSGAFTAWNIQVELSKIRSSTGSLSAEIDDVRRKVACIPNSWSRY